MTTPTKSRRIFGRFNPHYTRLVKLENDEKEKLLSIIQVRKIKRRQLFDQPNRLWQTFPASRN